MFNTTRILLFKLLFLLLVTTVNITDCFYLSTSYKPFSQQRYYDGSRTSMTQCNLEPSIVAAGGAIITVASAAIYYSGSDERAKRKQFAEWEEQSRQRQAERERLAFIQPRQYWKEEELKPYDGTDENGPILIAVNGDVYNVWKGRHFYGPGCEYHVFAGRDATRLLAKTKLEEETEEERNKPLSIADRATLQGWIYTFKTKYEIVGKLEGFDPSTTTTRTN